MRLVTLQPEWLEYQGSKIAVVFQCPHCITKGEPPIWLTCFFVRAGTLPAVHGMDERHEGERGERLLFEEFLRRKGHPDPVEGSYHDIVDCNPTCAWVKTTDDFATMSVIPSIDASASGHWHGFVTNGECNP